MKVAAKIAILSAIVGGLSLLSYVYVRPQSYAIYEPEVCFKSVCQRRSDVYVPCSIARPCKKIIGEGDKKRYVRRLYDASDRSKYDIMQASHCFDFSPMYKEIECSIY